MNNLKHHDFHSLYIAQFLSKQQRALCTAFLDKPAGLEATRSVVMPTSSQFNIIHTIESKKRQTSWLRVYRTIVDNPAAFRTDQLGTHHEDTFTPSRQVSSLVKYPDGHCGRQRLDYTSRDDVKCESADVATLAHSQSPKSEISATWLEYVHSTQGARRPPERVGSVTHGLEASNTEKGEPWGDMAPNPTSPATGNGIKKRLYCLGFRGLPGEKVKEREKLEAVLKQRPGIRRKPDQGMEEKKQQVEENPVVIEGITKDTVPTVDISSIDPQLLKPTALCFDATDLDITHQQLKKALDKVLIFCEGAKITSIQFEYRRVQSETLTNRWMLYADSQESRNVICGRQLTFGDRTAVLRRYDDLVLLAHKRALRAEAWRNVLGTK